jgi:hypothetical protein
MLGKETRGEGLGALGCTWALEDGHCETVGCASAQVSDVMGKVAGETR